MLVQRCEGEVRGKAPLSDRSRVGVAGRNMECVSSQTHYSERLEAKIRG